MDNLFAVIAPNADASVKNSIVERFLARSSLNKNTVISNNVSSSTPDNISSNISSNTSGQHASVYLVNYSNALGTKQAVVTNQACAQSAIVGNNRVDNKAALANLCGASANVEGTDNQLLLNAYQHFGVDAFAQVKGNFHTVLWDEASQRLCAAIDPFSSRALFYILLNGVFCISSDAKTLACAVNITPTVNKAAVSQWLSGRPDPNISMFNEISRLPLGSCLEYSAELGINITQCWQLDADYTIRYKSVDEYKAHFFELLKTSVSNRLAPNSSTEHFGLTSVFCQMSGGMDSTSVTAIANQLLNSENAVSCAELHTLSHRYKNTTSCDESNNINDMIEKLGLAHQHYIDLDQFESSTFAQLYPTDFDSPGVVLSPKYHQELALIQSVGAGVLLTGNGGDETCWGHSASYRSRLFKGELGVVNEVINGCKILGEPVARSLYKLFMPSRIQHLVKLARNVPVNALESPPWLNKQALLLVKQAALALNNPFSALFNPGKHARYQGLKCTSTYNAMRSYQKVASGYGVEVRHPFFDTDVVEFSFAVPEKLLIQGIYPKWLLRHTMQDYLPESVCWNKHKVVFDHHFANLVRSNRVELRTLLAHEGLQDLGLLNNCVLLREFDAVVDNPNGYLNVDMLYAILTQLWFQTHCV